LEKDLFAGIQDERAEAIRLLGHRFHAGFKTF
jgi:hypothetical protein